MHGVLFNSQRLCNFLCSVYVLATSLPCPASIENYTFSDFFFRNVCYTLHSTRFDATRDEFGC